MTAGGVEALEELLRVAGHIERLHRLGRQCFDEDGLVRLSLQRLDLPEWRRIEDLLATMR